VTVAGRRRQVREALMLALGARAGARGGGGRPAAIGAVLGMAVGAALALLLAPKRGAALRRDLAEAVGRARARWRRERTNGKAEPGNVESGG
jgi:hypothetical protein